MSERNLARRAEIVRHFRDHIPEIRSHEGIQMFRDLAVTWLGGGTPEFDDVMMALAEHEDSLQPGTRFPNAV